MGLKETIYENSPVFAQNLLCSTYGYLEKRKRFSNEFFLYLEWLEESQFWSADEIYEYKLKELDRLYKHSYNTVPYYRHKFKQHGLSENSIKELDDLKKIPVLSKEEVRSSWKELISNTHKKKLIPSHTSGSSGKALDFYVTKKSVSFQWAVWWRFRQRFGVNFNDKSLNFIGKQVVPIDQLAPPFWRVNTPLNQHLVNMQHLKPENIKFYVDHINAEKFKFFSGYPSIIYAFCSSVENLGLKVENPPQFVFTGAEKLLENQKSCIERVLNCTVTDQYGFSEGAGNASRCKENVFHEDFEFGILEPKLPSQNSSKIVSGEILATGFSNYGMPFIRYAVGDSATWSNEKCSCGRNSEIILNIEGRNEDYILTPEGTKILRFDYLFKDTRAIEECQVVQYKEGEIVLKIVKRQNYSQNVERELAQGVKKWISPTMKVKFDYVAEIERTNTGKFQAVKSYL